jgi:hypothetical protein
MAAAKCDKSAHLDTNIIGISADYVVRVRDSVLQTFDGPTLQHSIKEMDGERLRQLVTRVLATSSVERACGRAS